ncbi:MAG TPA: hypothetical protein VM537_05225 [Anaerolineae bacterium]|nr:hypothetical protein [Anaerolineae bacterium]
MTPDPINLTTIILALSGIAAAVAAVVAAVVAWRAARGDRDETASDIRKTEINGQAVVIANLLTEVGRLSARVTQLETDYNLLRRQYDHVLGWAMPRGYEPPPHW